MPASAGQRPRQPPIEYGYGFASLLVAETDVYKVPASRVCEFEAIVVYNSTAAGRTVVLHARQAPAGVTDAPGATNELMNELVPAHSRVMLPPAGQVKLLTLPEGSVISGNADAVGVNVWATGTLGDM